MNFFCCRRLLAFIGLAVAPAILCAQSTSAPAVLAVFAGPWESVIASNTQVQLVVRGNVSGLNYQWRFNGQPIAGATNYTLELSPVTAAGLGNYDVVLSNSVGSATSPVIPVTTALTPTIMGMTYKQIGAVGSSSSLIVYASGQPPFTYQWRKNGAVISGATTMLLSFPTLQTSDAGSYSVVVTNASGSATTSGILTVTSPPSIQTQPQSQASVIGGTATFTVVASGGTPLTYQWTKGGSPLAGKTSSTLTLTNLTATDAGSYGVTVTNPDGTIQSQAAILSVDENAVAPVITLQPRSDLIGATLSGANLTTTLTVIATGTAPLSYQWFLDGSPVSSATNSTLTIPTTLSAFAGNYHVVVSNIAGSVKSEVGTINYVGPVTITTSRSDLTLNSGGRLVLTATQEVLPSNPLGDRVTCSYLWRRNGAIVADGTGLVLNIASVRPSDAGNYTLGVTYAFRTHPSGLTGPSSAAAVVTVNSEAQAPVVDTAPRSLAVNEGDDAAFTVAAHNAGPLGLSYQWRRNGTPIAGATSASLTLKAVSSAAAGDYSVVVTNEVGSATSTSAALTVKVTTTAPAISQQPVNVQVAAGSNAEFAVAATGTAPLAYQWRKDGTNLAGATNATLVLTQVKPTDAGNYSVVVSNTTGSTTSTAATLAVTVVAPALTRPLANTTVQMGATATFDASATGSAPLTYQWQKNGQPIASATSSTLTFAAALLSDAGQYSVVVTNAAGSVTSETATLTVLGSQLTNLSIRSNAGSGSDALFVGFAVAGPNKPLLIRAAGPALAAFGVSGSLPDPRLAVHAAVNGADTVVASNDNWSSASNASAVVNAAANLGAFALGNGSLDAALLTTLSGGTYTVEISGPSGGNVLAELYDADAAVPARLVNASARAQVGSGGDILIAGFVITGTTPRNILIRATGPALAAFGVPGTLANPALSIHATVKGTDTIVADNDDWSSAANAAAVATAATNVGAFPLATGSRDAALLVALAPGAYTVQVVGSDGGSGAVLVELYEAP